MATSGNAAHWINEFQSIEIQSGCNDVWNSMKNIWRRWSDGDWPMIYLTSRRRRRQRPRRQSISVGHFFLFLASSSFLPFFLSSFLPFFLFTCFSSSSSSSFSSSCREINQPARDYSAPTLAKILWDASGCFRMLPDASGCCQILSVDGFHNNATGPSTPISLTLAGVPIIS